ncbi:MAG: ARPP-1 family domain-containing protein [Candidatus Thorarchaeota archaeon]
MSATEATKQIRDFAGELLEGSTFSLEKPISHQGMSVVPIVIAETTVSQDYINAAAALERGTLVITEAGDAVNSLLAKNTGDIPVLIEEAEVLVTGDSQDRIVVASVIIQPGEEIRIPVKCVHAPHGLNRGSTYSSIGGGSVPLKSGMRRMKYQSVMIDVEHYMPETAVDQSEVWAEVERQGKRLGIKDTSKYADAMDKIQKKTREIAEEIRNRLPENTCGFIVINTDGQPVALEFYRNSKAFRHRSGVLESLVAEYCDNEKKPVSEKTAREEALQLVGHLKRARKKEAISAKDSSNIVVGLGDLKGEAVAGETREGLAKLLYFTLGM